MKCLLDTHLLIWAALEPAKLSSAASAFIEDLENELLFSAASIWEVAIKRGLNRADFTVEPNLLRRGLLDNGYAELAVSSQHTAMVATLPPIHKDPFDRILVAQSICEGVLLLTADESVVKYGGSVRRV